MAKASMKYDLDLVAPWRWLTVTPGAWARQGLCYVQELGDFNALPRYYTEREGLDSFLIKYVVEGQGYLTYGGQRYDVGPGAMFWIDCAPHQRYGTAPGAGSWHVLWVHFTGAGSRAYYEQFLRMNGGCPVKALGPSTQVAATLRSLLDLYGGGQATAACDVLASALLTSLMAQAITEQPQEEGGEPGCVRKARAFLSRNYAQHITLDQLGEQAGLDKFYFQKLFKRYVGLSPNEYLLLARLTQAKRLLRETDRPVAQIAAEVGIKSVSHFIRLFRQQEHVTPLAYRRNWYSS